MIRFGCMVLDNVRFIGSLCDKSSTLFVVERIIVFRIVFSLLFSKIDTRHVSMRT